MTSHGICRRGVLKGASALVFTVGLALGTVSALAADKGLTLFEWAGYEDPGFHPEYIEKHGASPQYSFYADEEEAFNKLKAGFKADIAHPCAQSVPKWKSAGLLKPMDPNKITAWKDLNPKLRDMPGFVEGNKVWIVPIDWGNTSLTYRTDKLSEADVASLQIFADPKYRGKISIGDNVDDAYALGFLATGVKDWTSATDAQFKAASDFLRKAHKNVRFYWPDNATLSQSMASGEVLIAWAWNETATTMIAEGHKVAMKRDTKEGSSTWVCGFGMLTTGEGSEAKAYDYINSFLGAKSASYMVNEWGYGHANATALASLEAGVLESKGLADIEAAKVNTLFQSPTDPELRQKMIKEFEKIKAGF